MFKIKIHVICKIHIQKQMTKLNGLTNISQVKVIVTINFRWNKTNNGIQNKEGHTNFLLLISSANDNENTGYPCAKERNWTLTFHCTNINSE